MITAELMEAIEEYAQTRHTHGSYLYNSTTNRARQLLIGKLVTALNSEKENLKVRIVEKPID